MAAVSYLYGVPAREASESGEIAGAGLSVRDTGRRPRLAAVPVAATGRPYGSRGLRRLLPGVATLAVLAGVWFGASSLSSLRPGPAPSGVYIVRPGDTLWSIATRADPSGDPRTLVTVMEAELGTSLLVPGERVVVP